MFRKLVIAVIAVVAALLETMADAIAATLPRDRSGPYGGPHHRGIAACPPGHRKGA